MSRAAEIEHFAHQLAALTVTAARAEKPEQLAAVHDALAETFVDALALLSHDTVAVRELVDDLVASLPVAKSVGVRL